MQIDAKVEWIEKKISNYLINRGRKRLFQQKYRAAADFLKSHPQPPLSDREKKEIDDYWRQYWIKFPDYSWFEMFYGVSGIHDPRFIPDPIMGMGVYPYYNDAEFVEGWVDKNLFDRLLPETPQPSTYCRCYKGEFYDADWKGYEKSHLGMLAQKVFQSMDGDDSLVVKLSSKSSFGKGVKIKNVHSAKDIETVLLQEKGNNFIVQQKVRQHPFLQQFNLSSTNIFRVITWKRRDRVDVLSVSVRYGIEGSPTDVTFINGEEIVNVVGVNSDGEMNGRFANLQGKIDNHPKLDDSVIPNFSKIVEIAKKSHLQLQPFGLVGWDFTLDEHCHPICIEYNIRWPGTMLYQYVNGPYANEQSDEFLRFLKDRKMACFYFNKLPILI